MCDCGDSMCELPEAAERTAALLTDERDHLKAERRACEQQAKAARERAEAAEAAWDAERERLQVRLDNAEKLYAAQTVEMNRWARKAGEAERELSALRADRRQTAADALRRRLAATQETVKRLKATVVMMAVERAEMLTSMGVGREQAAAHVCDLWKLAAGDTSDGQWACETCGKPFEAADESTKPPEELRCHGSGAPPGPLDGGGRYRCPKCDYSVSVGPGPLSALPNHPPQHARETEAIEVRLRQEGIR